MDDVKSIINKLHPLEIGVLKNLEDGMTWEELTKKTGMQAVEVMRGLQWLQNKSILHISEEVKELVRLGENGIIYKEKGLPEKKLLECLKTGSKNLEQIESETRLTNPEINISIGVLKKKSAVELQKQGNETWLFLTEQGKEILDSETAEEKFLRNNFPIDLANMDEASKHAFDSLNKRKGIVYTDIVKIKTVKLTSQGKTLLESKELDQHVKKLVDRVTPEMLSNGSWKNKQFREYDVSINVPQIHGGKKHFVNQAIEYIKRIWMDMGFVEMTGDLVQTEFWTLDTLFVPQDHPARTEQDTFYIKNPKNGKLPENVTGKVKEAHENGGDTGSTGWQGPWNYEVASKNILRTHTTVLSAHTLSKLKKEDLPAKFFSVGKVFRNEALDWKHLFEFYQVEGIVVDPNANFRNLLGYLKEFFSKLGYPDVKIRPAHFPYTEPSVEIDVFHPGKGEWMEIGGAGMFRPEVVKPLLGFECPVLAWGPGMDRGIMEYYNINDLRDLYSNNIKYLKEVKYWLM